MLRRSTFPELLLEDDAREFFSSASSPWIGPHTIVDGGRATVTTLEEDGFAFMFFNVHNHNLGLAAVKSITYKLWTNGRSARWATLAASYSSFLAT